MQDISKTAAIARRDPKPEGHQLLVVANESRLVDTMQNGEWVSKYIGPRNTLPKGIYDLSSATKPDKAATTARYEGSVMHIDKAKNAVYQLGASDKGKPFLVKHDLSVFRDKQPAIGSFVKIEYTRGQGQVMNAERGLDR